MLTVADTICSSAVYMAYTSIAVGVDGLSSVCCVGRVPGTPTTSVPQVAKWSNAACTGTSTISLVDGTGDVGWFSSIAIGVDGLPDIAYHDMTNGNLKVVKCSSATCMPFVRNR